MSRRRPAPGWVPNQHGAWAMLVVPFLLGLVMAARAGVAGWHLLPLCAFWMLGYFAFHAASGWLKASARKRPAYVRPLVTYAAASAACGVATLSVGGWGMAWWVVPYLPLVLPALWLASRRRERATLGGGLTVAAACLMALVARYPDPRALTAAADAPDALALTTLLFGYFFGTVLYVKTNIREAGSRAYRLASLGWHAGFVLVAAGLSLAGLAAWWWTPFFVATVVRAALVPGRHWTPKQVGIGEAVLCVVLVVAFVARG